MTEGQRSLPNWILIVSGIFALMELMVSVALCVAPQTVVEKVDLHANGVEFIIYMWAARQFALGVIFAFATFKRSIPMLTIAYVFFLVMFIGDLVIGIVQRNNALIISSLVMCVISGVLLAAINRKKIREG